MKTIYWISNNLKTVTTWTVVLGVVFMLGVCTGVANAQTWNLRSLSDSCTGSGVVVGTPLELHEPFIGMENAHWKRLTFDGDFQVGVGGCTDTDSTNTDHFEVIDSGYADNETTVTILWNSGLAGIVLRSDGSNYLDGENQIFAWYDNGVPIWNVAYLEAGNFHSLGTMTCNTGGAGTNILTTTTLNGSSMTMSVSCLMSGTATHTFILPDPAILTGTHVGFFNRNGSGDNLFTIIQEAKSIPAPEPAPMDFTPFIYATAFLLGIAFVGLGEWKRAPMYLGLGAILIVGSAIATGIAWLMLLSGLVFLAVGGQMVYTFWSDRRMSE